MTEHQVEDPAAEALGKSVRAALMAAAAAAELIARHWRSQQRRAAEQSSQETRQLQAAYTSQRGLADLHLTSLNEHWFAQASLDDVVQTWETAHAWALLEPDTFRGHEDRVRNAVRDRFGIDPLEAQGSGSDLIDLLHDQTPSHTAHPGADAARANDTVGAVTVLATAGYDAAQDAADQGVASEQARVDAIARRATGHNLDPQLVSDRLTAARSQALPSASAVKTAVRRSSTRGPATTPTSIKERNRTGIESSQ